MIRVISSQRDQWECTLNVGVTVASSASHFARAGQGGAESSNSLLKRQLLATPRIKCGSEGAGPIYLLHQYIAPLRMQEGGRLLALREA